MLGTTGCSRQVDNNNPSQTDKNNPKFEFTRILCLSPSITEIVFAIGQGDRVAGVSDYSAYPPEALELPRCGGQINPNFEVMLSLKPDLIIAQGKAEDIKKLAERYDINALFVDLDNLSDIYQAIIEIGEKLNSGKKAKELVDSMSSRINELAEKTDSTPPVDTLLVIGRDPATLRGLHVAGPEGFLHEMLEKAGGRNIMDDLDRRYATVSKEFLARKKPEVIIELHGEGMMEKQERRQYLKAWQIMSSLPAVKNNRIYVIEESFAMIPGPRSVKIAERMAEIIQQVR